LAAAAAECLKVIFIRKQSEGDEKRGVGGRGGG
jgi:hypothetical protein